MSRPQKRENRQCLCGLSRRHDQNGGNTREERNRAVLEEKLRLVKEEQARLEAERSKLNEPGGLSPENLKKIREALNLM